MPVHTQALRSFKTGKGFSKNLRTTRPKRIQSTPTLWLLFRASNWIPRRHNDNHMILARAVRSLRSWWPAPRKKVISLPPHSCACLHESLVRGEH